MKHTSAAVIALALAALAAPAGGLAAPAKSSPAKPSPDVRAERLLRRLSDDQKLSLLHGRFPARMKDRPADVAMSAGYVPGVAGLGLPALRETDASLGVANAGRPDADSTALPSSLALAATWSPETAFAGGAMIGKETRQQGFNVLLAGGVNLQRDLFNGRNFEYLGEDPLLAGTLAGASIRGVQSQGVVSTAKHFALNAQETDRFSIDARIGEAALRESDLLAFELAIEKGQPGAVMCAYNLVNGRHACENPELLDRVLKGDWGWKGWVMSDWGAVHSVDAANAGLDQESGAELDKQVFFDAPLRAAVASGKVPRSRFEDMARRILRSMFANGLMDPQPALGPLDTRADSAVARREAEQAIVLLKNERGLLPLGASARRIVLIGAHADVGVLSGGGSSQVVPKGSLRIALPPGAPPYLSGRYYHPSSPMKALMAGAPQARVSFDPGTDAAAAAAAAGAADVAVVFAEQWAHEGEDVAPSLSADQEALIRAVARANPRTIVVLETGAPVLMPWIGEVGAVLEAWYPGSGGGEAIADVLLGKVNPSGRLPVTIPASLDQLPRSAPFQAPGGGAGTGVPDDRPSFPAEYREGSSVGYRWFAERGQKPLFPFGYGLSYTRFAYTGLQVAGGRTLTARVRVANTGSRAGTETVQVYLRKGPARAQRRLLGWAKVNLAPGQAREVTIRADRRLLANWSEASHGWKLAAGRYEVFAGPDAETPALTGAARVAGAILPP